MATLARLGVALFILLTWVDMTSAQTEQRVALVIGNGTYLNVRELKNPANDAKAMAAMLRRAGFDVIERENTTRRAMIEATRTFAEKLSPGGVGLFFYAGHGIQARGSNYLLPVDAALSREDDLKYEAVDVQDVLNKLDDARVRLSLVILDACRDNPFARSFRSTTRGLAQIDAPRGTLIAYATAPGKLAADGEGDNGVYTSELLKAMSEPGRTLQDVFGRVTDAVERRTANAQTPWISSSFRGDFYFIGPTTVTPVPPATSATPSQDAELLFWQTIVNSNDPADFRAYLDQYPQGRFAILARPRAAVRPQTPPVPQAGESGPERTPSSAPLDTTKPDSNAAVRPQTPPAPQAGKSRPERTLLPSAPLDATKPHSNEDWCVNKSRAFSPDQQISGCTALSASGKNVAVAYYNRSLAYREKGDLDRAIADSNEAIRLDPKFSAYTHPRDAPSRCGRPARGARRFHSVEQACSKKRLCGSLGRDCEQAQRPAWPARRSVKTKST